MSQRPENAGRKPENQPSLCSILSKKIGLNKSQKGNGEVVSSPASGQDTAKKTKEKKKGIAQNEIKTVLKKLKKNTPFLPKALQSPYAYEKGKKNCETCKMDKESYKSVMKSIKVIELIVEDVINKEQKDMLDKEEDQLETNKPGETAGTKGEKKISIEFEVYCQKDIDHNLKCVLVKLQKAMGDTLLQVCYCKAKKNLNDERCKKYDISVTILEHLMFEYTILTNSIIRLFKKPPAKPKTSPEVCVACMKEELTDCTETLENMLKNGRNLKVTMRNEDAGEKDKCCSRNYPHVHALVQERHVVLKFELPFEVTPPGQADDKAKTVDNGDKKSPTPYDEWPQDFTPKPVDEDLPEPTKDDSSLPKEDTSQAGSIKDGVARKEGPEKTSSASTKSVKSLRVSNLPESKPSKSITSLSPQGSKGSKSKSSVQSLPPGLESPGSKTQDLEPGEDEKYCGCNFDEVYEKMKQMQNENEGNMPPRKPFSTDEIANEENGSINSKVSNKLSNASEDNKSLKSKPSNAEQLANDEGKQLKSKSSNTEQNKNETSKAKKTKPKKKSSSDSSESEMSDDDIDDEGSEGSFGPIKRRKQVSFNPDQGHKSSRPSVYFMDKTTHSVFKVTDTQGHSIFENQFDEGDQSTISSKTIDPTTEKNRESTLTAVDSVELVKNKYSLSEKSKIKEFKQSEAIEKLGDLQQKSSGNLNKKQISEVLKDLGATKLLSLSFPAECYTNKISNNNFACISELPFSASLQSLPLDEDDLNHLTRAVEKLVSKEDILLIPDCNDEWELKYLKENIEDEKENKIKWYNAFTARDPSSNICIEIQTDKPITKNITSKIPSQKDFQNLPTIVEEDEEKTKRSSLSGDKVGGRSSVIKSKLPGFKTTELQYFTVEYPNVLNEMEIPSWYYKSKKTELKSDILYPKYHTQLDRYFKINPQLGNSNDNHDNVSYFSADPYFNLCQSSPCSPNIDSTKLYDKTIDSHPEKLNYSWNKSALDEMIMLDVIHLTSRTNISTSNNFSSTNSTDLSPKPFVNSQTLSKLKSRSNFFQEKLMFEVDKTLTSHILTTEITNSGAKEDSSEQKETKCHRNEYSPIKKYLKLDGSSHLNDTSFNKSNATDFNCNMTCLSTNSNLQQGLRKSSFSRFELENNSSVNNKNMLKLSCKEQTSSEPLGSNQNCVTVGNLVNLKRHNLNRRSYFISKKPRIKIVENIKTSEGNTLKQYRNATPIIDTCTGHKSFKYQISKPKLKYPRVYLVVTHAEIPHITMSPKNQEVEENVGSLETDSSEKTTQQSENSHCTDASGLKINVDKNIYKIPSLPNELEKKSYSLFQDINNLANPPANRAKSSSTTISEVKTFYLFDRDGLPLTDTSGRPLQSMSGEMLLKLNKVGSLCDLNNLPVFDSSGHAVEDTDFDPEIPPVSDSLKITTLSGNPIIIYDLEGRPLTSISGTMLVDADGKGLLRFGCTGKPISDHRGRPIYNSNGKNIVETK